MFFRKKILILALICASMTTLGCSSNQTVKDIWQGTRSIWYENVNVPASIDYDSQGSLSEYEQKLAYSMIGIDSQLTELEQVMNNADKAPTEEWVRGLFARFPWLSGFSGIKVEDDGTGLILGQVPGPPIKQLDLGALIAPENHSRDLRVYVQDTAMGPEVLFSAPLYDGHTFLGVVAVYFDIRALLNFSDAPDDVVIFTPQMLLWPGKYSFAMTPMTGIDWTNISNDESSGTVSNENGSFYWTIRYISGTPLIFASAIEGNFAETNNPRTGPTSSGPFPTPEPLKLAGPTPEELAALEAQRRAEMEAQRRAHEAAQRAAYEAAYERAVREREELIRAIEAQEAATQLMQQSAPRRAPSVVTPSPLHPRPQPATEAETDAEEENVETEE